MEDLRLGGLDGGVSGPQWTSARLEWEREELARRSCLDMLMSRFGFDAVLVSTPRLAKALGMSKSTIYASVKEGRFFIPHRMVGRAPMFTIDDVVSWYLSAGGAPKVHVVAASRSAPTSANGAGIAGHAEYRESAQKRRRDRDVDAWVAKAMESTTGRTSANDVRCGE